MKRSLRLITILTVAFCLSGAAHAKSPTFSDVPANIADAPVDKFLYVERRDVTYVHRWKVKIPDGNIWISKIWNGRYWSDGPYTSKSTVLGNFRKDGFHNFKRVESTGRGSQWGYMAIADWKNKSCIVGVVLDQNDHSHDGPSGGTLKGYATDCREGSEDRYDAWMAWFRSFKSVPFGYNATLD